MQAAVSTNGKQKNQYVFPAFVAGNDCIKIVDKSPETGLKNFYY